MITINNLSKAFNDKIIFKDFNLTIETGEMIAIYGPSGSGKTTLLNMIGLLDQCDAGTIIMDDVDVTRFKGNKRASVIQSNINYLFQNYALIDDESVYHNLDLMFLKQKISREKKEVLMRQALRRVNLNVEFKQPVYELSGGEQQRLSLARMMLQPKRYILCDEPTGNLDAKNKTLVLDILKELHQEGATVLIVTHDEAIRSMCDRVIELD